ncbi:MAG: sigma-70 family RNA polymerase sigma factor [Cyanobacteria bacterium P01_D01_bin.44]
MSQSLTVSWKSPLSVTAPAEGRSAKPVLLSNLELVIRCQRNSRPDPAAFSELVNCYQPYVNHVLFQLASDWSDRADLAQEVWIRVYRNVHRLQDPVKFKGWLRRIITNLFYDELRKRKRFSQIVSLDAPLAIADGQITWELPCGCPSPDERIMTHEFYDNLRAAIVELPEVFRKTITLRELQGLTYEEIADITGVSLGTVKSRIARARDRLQRELGQYLEAPSADEVLV